jgi:hypothetical protein
MKPLRVYIDTSVVGGCLEREFRAASLQLFARFREGSMVMVSSDLLGMELAHAPDPVLALMDDITLSRENVWVTGEANRLAMRYIEAGVIGKAREVDARHVATATVYRVDLLVSWDFRDIVNRVRIRGYNAVNASEGHLPLVIKSPQEVVRHG